MNQIIKGNAASKTSWTATALIVFGGIQQSFPNFVDLIPDQYEGLALSIVGAIMLILRNVTSQSIADKAIPEDSNDQAG